VAVKIKLKRMGKIRNPQYRIIVADSRTKRDGRAIEEIGLYHPKEDPSLIKVDSERAQYWLSVGAQPTDPVRALLKVTGDWQKFTGTDGAEGTLRTKQAGVDKSAVFAQVLAEAHKGDEAAAAKPAKATKPAKAAKQAEAATAAAEAPTEAPAETPAEAAVEAPAEDAPAAVAGDDDAQA
jgi:small subunit ribosomal protein S16